MHKPLMPAKAIYEHYTVKQYNEMKTYNKNVKLQLNGNYNTKLQLVHSYVGIHTQYVCITCEMFNPFTADPLKALHFAILV